MFVNTADSNHKGSRAELEVAAAAARFGLGVLHPLTEHGRYDLVLDLGGRLVRMQCKWGRIVDDQLIAVGLKTSRHTPSGYLRTCYDASEVDAVAVYCGDNDTCYLLPIALVEGRSSIHLRLQPPRNGQRASLHFAAHYEFPGAVAQLGERCRGTAEAVGSSPSSSTSLDDPDGESSDVPENVGAHEFRNRFGWYMERASSGEQIHVSRHGKPFVRLLPAA